MTLRRNFGWMFAGSTAFALSQWLVLVAIAKLADPGLAGDWTLGLATTAPLFILFQLKLRHVQATDARSEFAWGNYLALRLAGISLAMLAIVGIVVCVYRDRTGLLILLIGVAKGVDSLSDLAYGQLQKHEQMRRVATSLIGRGTSALIVGVVLLWLTRSALWIAVGTAASYALWLLWDWGQLRRLPDVPALRPEWARGPNLRLVRLVLPLGVVTALGSLQVNIPRYFLEHEGSRFELGIFGSLYQFLIAGNLVVAAIASATLPQLARLAARADWRPFKRLLLRMVGIGAILGVAGVVASISIGEDVLRLVFSDAYAPHADVLVWLSISAGLLWSYVFFGTALDAMRRFSLQPWIHGASCLLVTLASAILVPRFGMRGAAWAALSGYIVEGLCYVVIVTLLIRRLEQQAKVERP